MSHAVGMCCLLTELALLGALVEPAVSCAGEIKDGGAKLAIHFHRGGKGDPLHPEPTMRHGLVLPQLADAETPSRFKQLTYDPMGRTNNTCLKIDGKEYLLGHPPGKWVKQDEKLPMDAAGKPRLGLTSLYRYEEGIVVTQHVEIVRGAQSDELDTCLIRYVLSNDSDKTRKVGLRYLLDTYIGSNDGAPFLVPGQPTPCDTKADLNQAADMPAFVLALEKMDLKQPSVVAQLGLDLGKHERPVRLTLGGWPNKDLGIAKADDGLTLWDVPVFSMRRTQVADAAAVLYWSEADVPPQAKRELAFTYGLGKLHVDATGTLASSVGGSFVAGGEITLLALLAQAKEGTKVQLKLPPGVTLVAGALEQAVPSAKEGELGPVSWRLRCAQAGMHNLILEAGAGISLTQPIRILK